jgi:hypothetical protein
MLLQECTLAVFMCLRMHNHVVVHVYEIGQDINNNKILILCECIPVLCLYLPACMEIAV